MVRGSRPRLFVAARPVPLGLVVMAPSARAASRVVGCFSYAGTRYQGLATQLEWRDTSNGWHVLAGADGRTGPHGCVTYNLTGAYQNWNFRIHAVGLAPAWRGFLYGVSRYYGPSGSRVYYLGEGRLGFYFQPSTWTDPPRATTLQDEWLADMTARGSCTSSPAAQVACYMDDHGLVGNVVTRNRDCDGDGTIDGYDDYPNNPYYH